MPRPAAPRTAPWPSLGADVARVLAGDRAPYVSARTARLFATALESLRDDVWSVLTRHAVAAEGTPGRDRGQTSAAAELGVGRASVHRWVRDGWLLATRGREAGE